LHGVLQVNRGRSAAIVRRIARRREKAKFYEILDLNDLD
jgi:hypothetical protein